VTPEDGRIGIVDNPETLMWLRARFQAAAIFAKRMGDNPRVLLGHASDNQQLRSMFEQVIDDLD
jgi:hypothetical protein